ncbi:hypothetical protein BMW23_1177 [Bodo saltans virus]|uniref:Uncharacterized protein n=1 Tax=Bodo saltans virus TaxID=2024608 RepID=A0A2H4UWC1_9VIRU|nr:hypothetical protein QJ851_gp1157 [Bodo saltans virus]ATZ81220.1 hypothetical protein BMW23_1177 [Bodo saltans virus]
MCIQQKIYIFTDMISIFIKDMFNNNTIKGGSIRPPFNTPII